MTTTEIVLSAATALLNLAAGVIAFLYREIAEQRKQEIARTVEAYEKRVTKLEDDLAKERAARLEAAEKNTEWVLDLQQKSHEDLTKQAAIAEALLREQARGRR